MTSSEVPPGPRAEYSRDLGACGGRVRDEAKVAGRRGQGPFTSCHRPTRVRPRSESLASTSEHYISPSTWPPSCGEPPTRASAGRHTSLLSSATHHDLHCPTSQAAGLSRRARSTPPTGTPRASRICARPHPGARTVGHCTFAHQANPIDSDQTYDLEMSLRD